MGCPEPECSASARSTTTRGSGWSRWTWRFPTETGSGTTSFGWELPRGIVGPDETPAQAAVRETEEETGWRPAGTPRLVARFQPMPGMVDTPHEVYLVRGARHIGDPTDLEEAGRVEWVPLRSIPKMIRSGDILGSGSLVGPLGVLTPGVVEE